MSEDFFDQHAAVLEELCGARQVDRFPWFVYLQDTEIKL
uniref:Uncharacterized protein n=1 Tax=Pseudomonas putida TaxID=303 RepID=A0A6B7Q002_PSEPU|nr:hypothetical protein [Pseudomonas putida]